jgi:hypothetical protein
MVRKWRGWRDYCTAVARVLDAHAPYLAATMRSLEREAPSGDAAFTDTPSVPFVFVGRE